MARLVERRKARQELEDIAVRISVERPSAARKFLAAAQKTYANLAALPELGPLWRAENPRFQGLRYFSIPRYANYVIFYRPLSDGVEILHTLHGARDIQSILEAEETEEGDK